MLHLKKNQAMTIKARDTGSTYTMTLSFLLISPGFNIEDIGNVVGSATLNT